MPHVVQTGDFGLFSEVSYRNYSITIIPYSQLVSQRIGLFSPSALVKVLCSLFYDLLDKNKKGVVTNPDDSDVIAAQNGTQFDQYMVGNFLDPENGYPLIVASYLMYRTDNQNCSNLRELFKFLYWTKTDLEAKKREDALGYSSFNDANNQQIIDFLTSTKCDGKLILDIQLQSQHQGSSYPFYISVSLILLGISIILGAVWQYLNKSRCSKVVVLYQSILLIGITLTYLSVVFWFFVPDQDYICQCRVWLATMGYSLILTSMFERTWQIKRVYGKVVKGTKLTVNVTSFLEVGGGISIIIALQLIIMITWTIVDPFHSDLLLNGVYTFTGEYACTSNHTDAWLAVEAIFFGVLLVTNLSLEILIRLVLGHLGYI